MAKFTNQEIKAFIADYKKNTGEKLSRDVAVELMYRQAEHDAEATAGSGYVYKNGVNTGVEVQPEAGTEVVEELPELVPDIATPEGVPPAPTPPAAGPTLHVKQGLALRGGRGEWYKLLCQYDGKPVADYIAAGKANPASYYTARSVKCGQPKTPESRLSWFKRVGIVTIK